MIPAAVCFWALCLWARPVPALEPPRDFVLALSWQATFCVERPADAACSPSRPAAWAADRFALHGLWPNVDRNADGRVNAEDNYCLPENERAKAMDSDWQRLPAAALSAETRRDLDRVMPGSLSHLDRHQWVKHGTCSGLDPERYFAAAVALTDEFADTALSRFVRGKAGALVARRDLLEQFELDFGKGSARALRLFCKRPEGTAILAEIRLALRSNRIEQPLTRGSLLIPATPATGTCPTRFRIEAAD